MTQALLDAIGEYYVNSGVNLNELANLFKMDLLELVRLLTRREKLKLSPNIQVKVNEKKDKEYIKISHLLKVALKFRLSLINVCKIDGIDNPTEKDALQMWRRIEIYFMNKPFYALNPYRYLFNYEALNRPNKFEFSSFFGAKHFLKCLNEETNPVEKSRLQEELVKEETDFKNFIKYYYPGKKVSFGDINIIEKYRTKYAINQQDIADMLHIDKHQLQIWESQITNENLLYRINQLNSYQLDLHEQASRKKW